MLQNKYSPVAECHSAAYLQLTAVENICARDAPSNRQNVMVAYPPK